MNREKFMHGLRSNVRLNNYEREQIIKNGINRDRWKLRCTIIMEELAELQQAVSKQIRGFDDKIGLLEEIADTYISLKYLQKIFNIKDEDIEKAIDVKLERENLRNKGAKYYGKSKKM